jgi:hypothetical protein
MKKTMVLLLVLALAMPFGGALAAKKKKPKPFKSEIVSLGIAHPVFFGQTGAVNAITAREFVATCAIPASQGVDAWVFEVPAAYTGITASVKAIGEPGGAAGYDLDLYFFDDSCQATFASNSAGTDEFGYMPEGTAWIVMHNYLGDPNTQGHIEISAL